MIWPFKSRRQRELRKRAGALWVRAQESDEKVADVTAKAEKIRRENGFAHKVMQAFGGQQ